MAHNISTSTLGIDRFAYNKAGGDPWHKLGQPADGDRSIEEMLALSLTDYEVHKFQIYTQLEDGTFVEAEDHFMTGFEEVVLDTEGFVTQRTHFGPVKGGYQVEQNRATTEFAVALLDAAGGDGQIETIGALGSGETFFVAVRLPDLVVDPGGIADTMKRYICAVNGHAGTALRAVNSDVRVVCENTLNMAIGNGFKLVSIRHTASKEARKESAIAAMETRFARDAEVLAQAEALQRIRVTDFHLDRLIEQLYGRRPSEVGRKATIWTDRHDKIRSLFGNERNAGAVGRTGWAAYNAVTEYVDHHRPRVSDRARAMQAIDPGSAPSKIKAKAADRILALA